jgi:hypothetical protein
MPSTVAFGKAAFEKVMPVWPEVNVQRPAPGDGLLPLSVYDVTLQTTWFEPAFAVTATGFTVTVLGVDVAIEQTPFCTTALYLVVCVRLKYDWLVVVLTIGCQVAPLSMDDSHLITLPS